MLLDRFRIQPAEKRRFTIDYSQRLQSPLLLTTVANIAVLPVTTPLLEVTGAVGIESDTVVLYTKGGIDGTEYKMTILVNTTDADQCWEDEVIFSVEDF